MDNSKAIVLHGGDALAKREIEKPVLTFKASCSRIEKWSTTKSRMYVWVEGENILENLENRHSRPTQVYRELLAPVFQMLGVEKARWSQKAGCSCGCSPGFILDRKVFIDEKYNGNDVHITIAGAPKNDGSHRI